MTDCLIIGHNDIDFNDLIAALRAIGVRSGDYRNRNLAFIDYKGTALRAMDAINYFKSGSIKRSETEARLHNNDFLQPAIAALGSYLHGHGQLEIDYINSFHLQRDALREKLRGNIRTIAITTTFYVTSDPIIEIVNFIKKYNTTVRIILGGPYIASRAVQDGDAFTEIMDYLGVEFYIESSEGERTLLKLVKALKDGTDLNAVPNLYYRYSNTFKFTFKDPEKNELSENMVIWDLFKEDVNQFASIRTSKSCPFTCSFCGFPTRLGKYEYYDIKFLEQELDKLKDMGVKMISYIDDTFNVPKARFRDIMKMKIRNNYNFKWNSFFRCDYGDEETVRLMKESGCEGVFLGIESGSDTVLKWMNKSLRQSHIRKMVPLLNEAGILTYASLIVGFPGETEETFKETMDLISEVKPDFFRVQLWYCDKSTPIWKDREKWGIKGHSFMWSHNTMDVAKAADLMEKAFMTQQDSVWLPEDSFEFWSVFYLKRHGFSVEQIKTFAEKFRVTMARQKFLTELFPGQLVPDMEEMKQIVMDYDSWRTVNQSIDLRKELSFMSPIGQDMKEINTSFQL